MKPFWVDTGDRLRLAIVPRPRGEDWLEDDIAHFKQSGIDVLVSMLQSDEAADLGLAKERAACEAAGILFESFPVPDRETPGSTSEFLKFVQNLQAHLHKGLSIAVHCRASIGRSSLLLAAILCAEGFDSDDAFTRLSNARGLKVPDTEEQVRWVQRFYEGISR